MTSGEVEKKVRRLAAELIQTRSARAVIETQSKSFLGREVIELRVFLQVDSTDAVAAPWLWHFQSHFPALLKSAGLELAADDWFIPSQDFPSCSCWITPAPFPKTPS